MIWRSRSLSARSSKSIVFSRPGSSGRAEAGAIMNGLDQMCQPLTITLAHAGELFCSAWNGRHRDLPWRVHPLPIEPFEQGGELGCGQPHHPVLDLGPAELTFFQPLGDENHARAVPEHQLDPVGALGPEHVDRARERIRAHRLTYESCEAIGPFAEVD